jgi:hypothetical protein
VTSCSNSQRYIKNKNNNKKRQPQSIAASIFKRGVSAENEPAIIIAIVRTVFCRLLTVVEVLHQSQHNSRNRSSTRKKKKHVYTFHVEFHIQCRRHKRSFFLFARKERIGKKEATTAYSRLDSPRSQSSTTECRLLLLIQLVALMKHTMGSWRRSSARL